MKIVGNHGPQNKILSRYYSENKPASYSGINKLKKYLKFSTTKIKKALYASDAYTLHKPIKQNFKRRPVTISSNNEELQIDLIDVHHLQKENKGNKFILTAIDVFSKFAWAFPIKSKKGIEIVQILKKILSSKEGKKFRYLHTDRGSEFYNVNVKKFLKEKKIKHFSTYNDEMKASIIERFNRTLKIKLWKYFTKTGKFNYLFVLPKLVESYNNTYHSSIKTEPNKINKENKEKIWWNIYGLPDLSINTPKFKNGDFVRITSYKMTFDKGYVPSWREEIFKIERKLNTNPITYKVVDLNNEEIEGVFYDEELQHVILPNEFKIEKIIKSRGKGKRKEILVKWKGYSDKFNSWIKASELQTS